MTVQTQFITQDDSIVVNRVQDCQPIVEHCRNLSQLEQKGEMRLVAEIPMVIVEKYITDNGITMQEFVRENKHIRSLVNDPDLKAFRVAGGRF